MPTRQKEPLQAITFRMTPKKRKAVDKLVGRRGTDLSAVINAALDEYLEQEAWRDELVKESLRQADAGKFASEKAVDEAYARFGA